MGVSNRHHFNMYKLLVSAALLVAVMADSPPAYAPAPAYHAAPVYKEERLPPQPFAYEYGVADDYSKANFKKTESQDGNGVVTGPDHLIHLLIGELLSQVGHHVPELSRGDETVAVLVEDAERLPNLLLAVCVLHLPGHHGEELGEVDRAVAVGVHLVDHVLQLGLCGVLAQGPHHRSELLGGDGAVAILVEEGERLLELRDLLLGQLVSHFRILVSQSLGGGVWG